MKTSVQTILAAAIAAALSSTLTAQIIPDPTGVNTFATPLYGANVANYANAFGPAGLNLYIDSNATTAPLDATWTQGFADTSSFFSATGGTAKVIFLGESAGNLNDFGFIKQGAALNNVANYVPLASEIDNNNGLIASGWETYVNYGAGEKIDFWLNSVDGGGNSGTYFSFGLNGAPNMFAGGGAAANVKYKTVSVNTQYFDGTSVITAPVNTLVVSFEDQRLGATDADFTDFIFAFQFLPTQLPPVPEPSTYGLMGAAALVGLVALRRRKAAKKL
jgi:hypothetical protein